MSDPLVGFVSTTFREVADERDRLRARVAELEEEVADELGRYQELCGEIGHVWCECLIPCHIGCKRCDYSASRASGGV